MASNELYFQDEKEMKKYKVTKFITTTLLYIFLTAMAVFILFPFYWMIITSLKSMGEIEGPTTFWPADISTGLQNYALVFEQVQYFGRYFLNTIFVSACTTVLVVITSVGAGYAFAKLNFIGKDLLFSVLLMTMMIPGELMVVTNYMTISVWGWTNTYMALILPFGVSVFYIFFLRQTFQGIPHELYLAAKVDGVGDFKYLFKVMIPIAMPAITTIIILSSMGAWNALIWPQLAANDDAMRMVANGLMQAFVSDFGTETNLQLAASTVVTLPILVFFMVFRKTIMSGVSRSGIKG